MFDICFIVLNFNIVKETIDCVESIMNNIDTSNYHIIIVDNGSREEVFEKISKKYENCPRISIYKLEQNVGFAKGNNFGIEKAIGYGTHFVCCLNNDTLLEQKDFYQSLISVYADREPAVIGPKIILKDGSVLHMDNRKLLSIKEYENVIEGHVDVIFRLKRVLLKNRIIYNINKRLKKNRKEEELDDVIIHGCCVIFTPSFFGKLRGFDDRTFLYMEEELLYIELKKANLMSRYAPILEIKHLEDVSTDSIMKSDKEKAEFKKKYMIQSFNIIKKELALLSDLNIE